MSRKQSNATKQANMQQAKERAAAVRAEQHRKERRSRLLVVTAVVLGVLLVVVAIAVGLQQGGNGEGQTSSPPASAVEEYAVAMGDNDAPVTVTVYEDLMCPYCGQFEQVSSEPLKGYAESGDVQVRYHVVSFLDSASDDRYSTRAANALAVVLDTAGAEAAVEFHDALFAHQPAEGGPGLSDEEMIDLAVEAGADEAAIASPIEDLKFEPWVEGATDAWSKAGFTGTPTVTVNGEKVEFTSAEDLLANTQKAIDEALGAP
ncbi:MAG TPA: thioredoxin domain-containing protein [Nocardioidaceae bacterium]|nr:thioredoxin domain-containing protein [Nocardioidaceae bacterium]